MKVFPKRLINLVILLMIAIISSGASQALDAWSYAGDNLPEPTNASWISATLAQKNAILYNDSNIWETKLTTGHDQYDDQLYRFNVMQPGNEVTNLTVKWLGHGENKTGYDTYLYIWNYSDVSWELLDTKNLGVEGTLNRSITINPGNYIDLYGIVYIAARAKHYDYAPLAPSGLSLAGDWEAPITCSWSPVTDLDGDSVQYYAEILESGTTTDSSGWINETSFTSQAWTGYYSCRVKTRDNFTYIESSAVQSDTIHLYYSLNTNHVELKLAFNPGYNISGYITDLSSGLPIGGAFLQTNYNINTTTNENGFYSFTLLNSTYTINASKFGYDANATTVTVNGGDLTNVNISLFYKLHTLSGYITDKSSSLPIGGAFVQTNTGLNTTTNASGYYNFTVFDGIYTVNASKIGYDNNAKTVTVNGGDLANVNIQLLYHPYDLSGYITDKSSGLPLGGVTVKTSELLSMTTSADGFYNFTLIDGEHSIVAILQNYAINSTTLTINGANIINVNISLIPAVPQGNDAWHSVGYSLPLPYSVSWIPATLAQKNAILYNDSNIWETKLTTGHDQYDDQLYRFNVMQPGNEVTNLTVKWLGHGENKTGYDTYLYIWNYSDVSWELLDTKNLGVEGTLNRSITINPGNYIDLYGFVYIAARARHYDYAPLAPSGLSLVGDWEAPITCSWSPVTDLDGDSVQYYAEILESGTTTDSSGWINETSFTSQAWTGYYSCRVKTRDNFTYTESSVVQSDTIHLYYSLNTNYVELKVNNQLVGNGIFNLRSANTSTSSFITWNNYVFSDNRVYYGLNETDVNNLVNGSWSVWNNYSMNPAIRLAGLLTNKTYYYRPLTWYLGMVNNSVKAKAISTSRPGVWVGPSEYMVSPIGWIVSPVNFRTINISVAPLDSNGHYISNLSLKAIVYNNSGIEIGRIDLVGMGPYYGNFTLPDYFSDENGYVIVPNYSIAGEFSVLKWSCKNCHADGERSPSTFNSATVHPPHNDTRPSTGCESCHYNPFDGSGYHSTVSMKVNHAYKDTDVCSQNCHYDGGSQHISIQSCTNSCHKPNPGLTCNECHNDVSNSSDVSGTSVLSPIYGKDVHLNKKSCTDCHGGLLSINSSPSCTNCHPLNGSNLTTVPDSIGIMSHSGKKTVACGLCHNHGHDIKSLTVDAQECKNCHPGITHNNGAQCITCHGNDPHDVSVGGCIACHSFPDMTYFVNISLFGRHANISKSDGLNNVSDEDCKACHFGSANGSMNMESGAANETNTYFCQDCHTSNGRNPAQFNSLTDENLRKMPMPPGHGNNGCPNCHIVGVEKTRPLTKELRYHSYGPKGYSDMPS